MDTWPKHVQVIEKPRVEYATKNNCQEYTLSATEIFRRGEEARLGRVWRHRRGALTTHSAEKIGAAAGVVHE